MTSALYEGRVRHLRLRPAPHAFQYSIFQIYLDLSELDDVFRGRWLWSTKRPALAWFKRADHLGNPDRPLETSVRDLVESTIGVRPAGPIRLLTHLRYFGYVMNPVSFYYCFDPTGVRVETIVAEINNTPWGEQHCYVLSNREGERAGDDAAGGTPARLTFEFEKTFHVSPFMPMGMDYRWQFTEPDRRLAVHMTNIQNGEEVFHASLALDRRPITGRQLARVLVRYPLVTVKVIAGIYWQALRLWLKRTPYHPHPTHVDQMARPAPARPDQEQHR